MTAELRAYQQVGVDWLSFLKSAGLGAVLADDMGLGKTLQTICVLSGRALVVCPKSVVYNWADEIARFRPGLKTVIYHGERRELDQKADVNAALADGTTALHWAVQADDLDSVNLLLQAGANAKVANRYGVTPLHIATANGNAAVIGRLLRAGADPDARDASGETLLMMAIRRGNIDSVAAFVERGVQIDATDTASQQTAPNARAFPGVHERRPSCGRVAARFQSAAHRDRTPQAIVDLRQRSKVCPHSLALGVASCVKTLRLPYCWTPIADEIPESPAAAC